MLKLINHSHKLLQIMYKKEILIKIKPKKLNPKMNKSLTNRAKIEYDVSQQEIMLLKKQNILNEIKINQLEKTAEIYPNQIDIANKITRKLCDDRQIINIMILAKTQSGKTGTMCALIKQYLQESTTMIPIENIYIITGLSSTEWVTQTKDRMPNSIKDRVYHRDKLASSFVKDIKEKNNVLVIIDEIQIAAKENQTLYKCFENSGFYDKQNLFKKDIKIIEFTATPDGTIYDLMNWGKNGHKIMMQPSDKYVGSYNLLQKGRVKQYIDFYCYNRRTKTVNKELLNTNLNIIKKYITTFKKPLYHIIRTPNGSEAKRVIENFRNFFGDSVITKNYDKESEILDLNEEVLVNKPKKHTFIFIKEKLRCAKTLKKNNLGILCDRYTRSVDDAVIVQGLVGRATGYDDNGISIVFTNVESIEKYEKLWLSSFNDTTIKWKSKTTKHIDSKLTSKDTFNSTKHINGFDKMSDTSTKLKEPVIKKFSKFEDVKYYVIKILGNKRGPNNPKKNKTSDGFYECNVRGNKKIWSTDEMYNERKCNIKNGAGYGFRYCYENIKDKSTLQFWIIHY